MTNEEKYEKLNPDLEINNKGELRKQGYQITGKSFLNRMP